MKNSFFLIIILLVFSCKEEKKQPKLADLNIIIDTNLKIDSIRFSDISQTKWYSLEHIDTIKLHLDKPLNDLFNFWFYTESGKIRQQVWLDGEKVIIKSKLNTKFEIDTVLNSKLYYTSINYTEEFKELKNLKTKQSIINQFILENVKENLNNPLSLALGDDFLNQNQNNKEQILELKNILGKQKNIFKDHFFNIDDRIESLLKINDIEINDFNFFDRNKDTVHISLKKNMLYLLDFWFVNCPPCLKQHIEIAKNISFLHQKNIEVIGISKDENHAEWANYLSIKNYNWQNYREHSSNKKLTQLLHIESFPSYYLINAEGKIISIFDSFSKFKTYLENNPE